MHIGNEERSLPRSPDSGEGPNRVSIGEWRLVVEPVWPSMAKVRSLNREQLLSPYGARRNVVWFSSSSPRTAVENQLMRLVLVMRRAVPLTDSVTLSTHYSCSGIFCSRLRLT